MAAFEFFNLTISWGAVNLMLLFCLYILSFPYDNETGEDNYRKVKYLANKALEIDPNLAEDYEVPAYVVWRGDWNWREAERLTRKALEVNHNYDASHSKSGAEISFSSVSMKIG